MTELITKGRHYGVCTVIQFGETAKGDPQIALGFEIVSASPEDRDFDEGRGITYFGTFGEAAPGKSKGPYDFTVEALRNIGWKGDELAEIPALVDAGELKEMVELIVNHEEYDGKTSARIQWVNRIGGGAVKLKKPMTEQELKVFSASMKSRLRATLGGAPAAGPAQRPLPATTRAAAPPPAQRGYGSHPNAPGDDRGAPRIDDDIPF